jgi:hypothetical protein
MRLRRARIPISIAPQSADWREPHFRGAKRKLKRRPAVALQRMPARSTGPPRFVGVPGRTASRAAARATGRGRSTTPALAMHPAGYSTYWQYTTALAGSVLAATNPVISSADSAIENFILVSSILIAYRCYECGNLADGLLKIGRGVVPPASLVHCFSLLPLCCSTLAARLRPASL